MNKSIIYMLQESVSNAERLTEAQLEEARNFVENNPYKGLKYKTKLIGAEEVNQNGRLYKFKALDEGMKKAQHLIDNDMMWFEESHPMTDNPRRFATVLMSNSVCKLNSWVWEDNSIVGVCETLQTAKGKDLKGLLLQGVMPGVSLRAMGKVQKRNGINIVENNLRIISFDNVLNPSHKDAIASGIITENTDIVTENFDNSKIITESELFNFIENKSENVKILQDTLLEESGGSVDILDASSSVKYNLKENTAVYCLNGSCISVMLEEEFKNKFDGAFDKLLRGY